MLLQIKQWECIYLKDFEVVKDDIISEGELFRKIESMYYDFVSSNSIEPFTIKYGRGKGFCIIANSHIGVIVYDDITLYIRSMVPKLTLGKILYLQSLAQEVSSDTTTKKVLNDNLNDEESISAVDYFIVSLINSFEDIKQNGLLTDLLVVKEENARIVGKLSISDQIAKYPAYDRFCVEKTTSTIDIYINQVIKAALEAAKSLSSLEWIIPLISDAIDFLNGVKTIDNIEPGDFPKVEDFTAVKREEYNRALQFSKYILFGYDPLKGDNSSYFPEFMLDMNVIFEFYVNIGLKRLFKNGFENKKKFSLGVGPIDVPIEVKNIELDGFYFDGQKTVVLDTKDKYREVLDRDTPDFFAANPDLYQQYYYASRVNAEHIILVYPSSKKHKKPIGEYELNFEGNKNIKMYFWALQIAGTPRENRNALVNLAQFIDSLQ